MDETRISSLKKQFKQFNQISTTSYLNTLLNNYAQGKIHSIAKTNVAPPLIVSAPNPPNPTQWNLQPIQFCPESNPILSRFLVSQQIPEQVVAPIAASSIQQVHPQPQPILDSSSSLPSQQQPVAASSQQQPVAASSQIAPVAPPEQVQVPPVQIDENLNASRIGYQAAAAAPIQINEVVSQQSQSQVQVQQMQQPAGLVNCMREPLVQILSIKSHTLLVLVTETSVLLQPVTSLHNPSTAVNVYSLPQEWRFTNAFPASNHILLSACTEDDSFGIVSINMDVNSAVPERRDGDGEEKELKTMVLKKTFLSHIETSPITAILWEENLGILMFSTESGNIHGFSSNLERIFFFEEPNGNSITNILYDSFKEIIIYTTSAGLVATYDMNTEISQPIFQGNGHIIKAQFVSACKGILLIFENSLSSSAVYVSYPKMQQKFQIGIDSPNYACIFEDPITNNSESSSNSSSIVSSNSSIIYSSVSSMRSSSAGLMQEEKVRYRKSFGILSKSKLSIFSFNRKQALKVYSKTLHSEPTCFTYKSDLSHMKLIEAYYSNPMFVRNDKYAKDRCRYLIDNITANYI